MKMMQKLMFVAMTAVSTASFAGGYGVVDVQKAMLESNYVKAQLASRDQATKANVEKLSRLEKEIVALQQKAESGKLPQAELEKLSKEHSSKIEEFNKNSLEIQKSFQQTQQLIERTLFPQVEKIIEELRVANGYDMILDRKLVLGVDRKLDLTSQVTQKINATVK